MPVSDDGRPREALLRELAELRRELAERDAFGAAHRATGSVVERSGPTGSDARFRQLADTAPAMLWVTDSDHQCTYLSQSWYDYTGQTEQEGLGLGWTSAVHPDDRDRAAAAFLGAAARGEPFSLDYRLRTTDGEYRWAIDAARPRLDATGQFLGYVGSVIDVHERKQAEAELNRSTAMLGAIAAGTTDLIAAQDSDYRYVYFNEAYQRAFESLWGKPLRVGVSMLEALANWPEEQAKARQIWARAHAGESFNAMMEFGPSDDDKRVFDLRFNPLLDTAGRPIGAAHILRDVTEQVRTERALRESEERFRNLADHMSQFAWMADANGLIFWYNRRWYDYTGTTLEQMQGWGWKAVHHPDYVEGVVERIQRAWDTGEEWEDTFPLRGRDGEYRWFLSRAVPIRDDQGTIVRWFGTNTDITESKRVEAELRASRERLRHIADSVPQLVWIAREDGTVEYYNSQAKRYRGIEQRTPDEWEWRPVIHPDDLARTLDRWEHARANTDWYECEHRVRMADGSWRWHLSRARRAEEDGRIRWYGTATDIDDAMRYEQQLLETQRDLELANRTKDQFLAALSHELRTPLTPALMTVGVLELEEQLPQPIRDGLSVVRHGIETQVRLIDDLLDLTRVARGKIAVRQVEVHLHRLIRKAMNSCCDESTVNREFQFETDLRAQRDTLCGDPTRLEQVMWNLLRNAIKFTPDGGHVRVETSNPEPGWIRVRVRDTGRGISPEVIEKIFDAFEQGGEEVTREFGGLGLGLPIAKTMVHLHGGRIHAESGGRGKGSCFTVDLPLQPGCSDEATVDAQSKPERDRRATWSARQREPADAGSGAHILLVEDHAPTGQAMQLLLARLGHTTVLATSVSDALLAAAGEQFQLVISDWGLPDGTGCDLMRELRLRHGLTGIALTGFGSPADIQQGQAAGFQDHLVKPIDIKALQHAIDRLAG